VNTSPGAVDALVAVALVLVTVTATCAALTRDPVRQSVVLSVLGVCLTLLFLVVQAPDVALSQLAVGSAITPLLILLTVRKVRREPHGARAARTTARAAGRTTGPSPARPAPAPERTDTGHDDRDRMSEDDRDLTGRDDGDGRDNRDDGDRDGRDGRDRTGGDGPDGGAAGSGGGRA
jgi:uncharacterized MnhB-related membrane protein